MALANMERSRVSEVRNAQSEARVITWNINGLRKVAASHGGLKGLLDQFAADIVCLQEIKITRRSLVQHDLARANGYHCLFSHCKVHRKLAYSGVATFIRSGCGLRTLASTTSLADAEFFGSPGSFSKGLSAERLGAIDSEGRVLVTDHGHFMLFNVYGPCISSDGEDEKTEERRMFKRDFLVLLQARIFEARGSGRGVVLVGDLNACASQLDHGFTITDTDFFASNWSKWIRGMLDLDSSHPPRLVDCFRRLNPDRKGAFTCWNTQTGARENNYGTRIDYIIADTALADRTLQACDIMPDFLGSDHCPVRATFSVPLLAAGQTKGITGGLHDSAGKVRGAFGDEREWPEHPPDCSCFYRELTSKQEKLDKYFAASDSRLDPAGDSQGEETSSSSGSANGRTTPCFFSVGAGADVQSSTKVPVFGVRGSSRGTDRLGVQARRGGGAAGRETNNRSGVKARGERRARQSKLTFGPVGNAAAPSASTAGTGRDTMTGWTTANREYADNDVIPSLRTGGGRVPSLPTTYELHVVQSRAGGKDSSQEHEMPPESGGASAGGQACTGEGETAVRENVKGESVDPWKALFGNQKSTPPCEHGEPSIQRTVLKAGPNQHRRFYTCARSAGNWPSDRNARCNFFQWRLDGVRGYKDRPPRTASGKRQRRG